MKATLSFANCADGLFCRGQIGVSKTQRRRLREKSSRTRRRKVPDKPPGTVSKRLRPSVPHVCHCTELLTKLRTTINEPPSQFPRKSAPFIYVFGIKSYV